MTSSLFLPDAAEMRSYDACTIAGGISTHTLMERAGRGCAEYLIAKEKKFSKRSHIVICCGPGNNGGDGLVIARILLKRHYNVITIRTDKNQLYLMSEKQHPKKLSKGEASAFLMQSNIIIDALLGTGQTAAPRAAIKTLTELIQKSNKTKDKFVIAIDIPTGIDCSTGTVFTPHIDADLTLTIQFRKRGMAQFPGKAACGRQVIIPIGITAQAPSLFSSFTPQRDAIFPKRFTYSHKGTFGSVLVIGGSRNMPGAPKLAAHAALRAGAGTVTQAVLNRSEEDTPPEIMLLHVESKRGLFQPSHLATLRSAIEKSSAVILGPGLSTNIQTKEFVRKTVRLLDHTLTPVVIDADALNALAPLKRSLSLKHSVCTPHPGEAARLLGTTTKAIEADRYAAALTLAKKTGGIIVLKGASTIIASATGGLVHEHASPYLATAGSGDVLSGIIGSLLAQGLTPFQAAATGVYIHAQAGITAVKKTAGPIIASDITAQLPRVIGIHQE
jgi:NAD(P)H-hydrate epimerase